MKLQQMLRTPVESVCGCVLAIWDLLFTNAVRSLGYRSNNFIVGLTNTNPANHAPVLWQYTLCGQYPGAVPDGATVSVQCTDSSNRRLHFQYVIVQFPLINEPMNFCEIKVFTAGNPASILTLRCPSIFTPFDVQWGGVKLPPPVSCVMWHLW